MLQHYIPAGLTSVWTEAMYHLQEDSLAANLLGAAHAALQLPGCQRAGRLLLQGVLDAAGHQLQAAAVAVALSAPAAIRQKAVGACLQLQPRGLPLPVGQALVKQVRRMSGALCGQALVPAATLPSGAQETAGCVCLLRRMSLMVFVGYTASDAKSLLLVRPCKACRSMSHNWQSS